MGIDRLQVAAQSGSNNPLVGNDVGLFEIGMPGSLGICATAEISEDDQNLVVTTGAARCGRVTPGCTAYKVQRNRAARSAGVASAGVASAGPASAGPAGQTRARGNRFATCYQDGREPESNRIEPRLIPTPFHCGHVGLLEVLSLGSTDQTR